MKHQVVPSLRSFTISPDESSIYYLGLSLSYIVQVNATNGNLISARQLKASVDGTYEFFASFNNAGDKIFFTYKWHQSPQISGV